MRRKDFWNVVGLVLALWAATFIIGHVCGCKPAAAPLPGYCYDGKAFTAALVRCVDASADRVATRACRKKVHESCGIIETISKASHEP